MKKIKQPIDPEKFEAVLFDLDGVITDSAKIHATCWKLTFDSFLKNRQRKTVEFSSLLILNTTTCFMLTANQDMKGSGVF